MALFPLFHLHFAHCAYAGNTADVKMKRMPVVVVVVGGGCCGVGVGGVITSSSSFSERNKHDEGLEEWCVKQCCVKPCIVCARYCLLQCYHLTCIWAIM